MDTAARSAEQTARSAARRTGAHVAPGGAGHAVEAKLLHQRVARLPHAAHPHCQPHRAVTGRNAPRLARARPAAHGTAQRGRHAAPRRTDFRHPPHRVGPHAHASEPRVSGAKGAGVDRQLPAHGRGTQHHPDHQHRGLRGHAPNPVARRGKGGTHPLQPAEQRL